MSTAVNVVGRGRRFEELLASTKTIAREVASLHAPSVDKDGRFPEETFKALREAKLLSTLVPTELGGDGLSMEQLGALLQTTSTWAGAFATSV